jgi:hypothetical protein
MAVAMYADSGIDDARGVFFKSRLGGGKKKGAPKGAP